MRDWRTWLLVAWFAVPITITLLVSLVRPIFLARYLIICLPALVLLVAAGLTTIRWKWITAPALALICWMALDGVRSYYQADFDISREDLRGATSYVLQYTEPGDVIAFHKGQNRFAFAYYASRIGGVWPSIIYPGSNQPTWRDFFASPSPPVLDKLATAHGRVWLVMSQTLAPQGEDAAAERMKAAVAQTHSLTTVKILKNVKIYLYEEI